VLVKTHGMMLLHNTTYIGFVVVRHALLIFRLPGSASARRLTSHGAPTLRQFWRTMDCWRS
jgi:hypothetical protein